MYNKTANTVGTPDLSKESPMKAFKRIAAALLATLMLVSAACTEKVRIVFHIPQKENEGREKR